MNNMDTDDLSRETYTAIMIEAEKFNHNLTLQFGLLSYSCTNEEVFIVNSKKLINELKKARPDALEDLFFGEPYNKKHLYETLDKMLKNIENVEEIPLEKRHFDF